MYSIIYNIIIYYTTLPQKPPSPCLNPAAALQRILKSHNSTLPNTLYVVPFRTRYIHLICNCVRVCVLHTKYREILQTVAGDSIGIFSNLKFTNMLYVPHIHVYVIEHTIRNIALFDPNLQITYTVFTFTYTMLVKQAKQKMC